MFHHPRWSRRLAVLVAIAGLLALPALAFARAGGGGNYGGGGGGGGGFGGGGGDGGGELLFYLIWLCIRYPYIGIPVAIVVVVAMSMGAREAQSRHVTRTIRRGRAVQADRSRDSALETLKSRDPNFDEVAFLDRVSTAFVRIQDAWSEQNLTPVRPFVSDGVNQRFQLYLDMQRADGYRNAMRDVHVSDARIVSVQTGSRFDTIHVEFTASAVDEDVDLESGRRIRGSSSPESFVEYWSFHRKPGARTLDRPGAVEGSCPSCGAPLDVVDRAQCKACGSTVNSGDHDWVLAEITQAGEWRPPAEPRHLAEIAELEASDPGFSLQHVEDRVSVAFWRLRAAEFFSDPGYVEPVLAETMADDERTRLLARAHDDHCFELPAVGAVEVIGAELDPVGFDRIRVMIRWSGKFVRRKGPRKTTTVRPQAIYSHVFTLARRHGTKTDAERAFASASCTSCGAPIAVSEQASCAYCGANLVDGSRDWVLESVGHYTADQAIKRRREVTIPLDGDADRELTYAVLAKIMALDGKLHEKEKKILMETGRRRGMTNEQMQAALNSAVSGDVDLPVPRNQKEAREYLELAVRASLADGRISSEEQRFLSEFGEHAGLSAADVKLIVNRERGKSYREAKRILRADRSTSQSS